jgi:hypothetical protein
MTSILTFYISLGVSLLFFILGYIAQRKDQSSFASVFGVSDRLLKQSASVGALFVRHHSIHLFKHSHRKTTTLFHKTRQYMSATLEQSRGHVSNGIRGRRILSRNKAPSPFFETLHKEDTGVE